MHAASAEIRGAYAPFDWELEGEVVMFSLVKELGLVAALRKEAVPLLIAFVIAEFFYKFKSFALECVAFLVTWFVFSYLLSLIVGQRGEGSR